MYYSSELLDPLRFRGKSSDIKLAEQARKLKEDFMDDVKRAGIFNPQAANGDSDILYPHRRPEFWTTPPVGVHLKINSSCFLRLQTL